MCCEQACSCGPATWPRSIAHRAPQWRLCHAAVLRGDVIGARARVPHQRPWSGTSPRRACRLGSPAGSQRTPAPCRCRPPSSAPAPRPSTCPSSATGQSCAGQARILAMPFGGREIRKSRPSRVKGNPSGGAIEAMIYVPDVHAEPAVLARALEAEENAVLHRSPPGCTINASRWQK